MMTRTSYKISPQERIFEDQIISYKVTRDGTVVVTTAVHRNVRLAEQSGLEFRRTLDFEVREL